jgi:hypothetical protein
VGHHDDHELVEALALGLVLGGRSRRRTVRQPGIGSGCSNACGCLVVAAVLCAVGSLSVQLWYVALPLAVTAVTWGVVRHRRRVARRRPG